MIYSVVHHLWLLIEDHNWTWRQRRRSLSINIVINLFLVPEEHSLDLAAVSFTQITQSTVCMCLLEGGMLDLHGSMMSWRQIGQRWWKGLSLGPMVALVTEVKSGRSLEDGFLETWTYNKTRWCSKHATISADCYTCTKETR